MKGTSMTTTAPLSEAQPGTEVATFAAAVRAALADLPPDELDELTDGLEADLAEQAADAGGDLGDPVAYAEELRAAAGYPPRAARSHRGSVLPDLRVMGQGARRRWEQALEHTAVAAVVDFLVSLRAVWWVLRGVAVHLMIVGMLGANGIAAWPLAVALIILSVQIGRGRLQSRAWQRWAQRAVSAIVIVASPFLFAWMANSVTNSMYPVYEETWYPNSLNREGVQIDNIFAFDAAGEPIEQVQLFDQNGNPLNLVSDTNADFWGAQDGSMLVPSDDVPGRAGWNVFPLAHANSWSDYEDDGKLDESEISETRFPALHVKPLAGYVAPDVEAPVVEPTTEG